MADESRVGLLNPSNAHHVIRTTHRRLYKKCRRAWDWEVRRGLEPVKRPIAFDFGTAMHAAFQTYYNPELWDKTRKLVTELAIAQFRKSMQLQWKQFTDVVAPDPEDEEEWETHIKLGLGMLAGYFRYAQQVDKFTPIAVETEFYIPIPGLVCPCHNEPILYECRFDLLVQDSFGELWLVDHKTASKFYTDMLDMLALDEQMKSYAWGTQVRFGSKVAGVIYNEIHKSMPHPPKVLKSKPGEPVRLSVDKGQNTSLELYLAAINQFGLRTEAYTGFLSWLQDNPRELFRRYPIHYTTRELNLQVKQIQAEALEMIDPNIPIYPNPTRMNCSTCSFRSPCIMASEGSDPDFVLRQDFVLKATR